MEKSIKLSTARVTRFLTWTTLAIFGLSLVGLFFRFGLDKHRVLGFVHTFNFEQETNVPTLFTTLLLLSCSGLLHLTWRLRDDGKPQFSWLLLSFLALFLAYDEYAFVHESIAHAISGMYPEWYFIIPYAIVGIIVAAFFLPIFIRLSRRVQILMCTGAALYVIGALDSLRVITTMLGAYNPPSASASFVIIIEELAELFGLIIAIKGLLLNLLPIDKASLSIRVEE